MFDSAVRGYGLGRISRADLAQSEELQQALGKYANGDMVEEKKKQGALARVRERLGLSKDCGGEKKASLKSDLAHALTNAAAVGAVSLGVSGLARGGGALYDMAREPGQVKAMVTVRPELKNYSPQVVRDTFRAVRQVAPDVASDPLLAGSMVHTMIAMGVPADNPSGHPVIGLNTIKELAAVQGSRKAPFAQDALHRAVVDTVSRDLSARGQERYRDSIAAGAEERRQSLSDKSEKDKLTAMLQNAKAIEDHKDLLTRNRLQPAEERAAKQEERAAKQEERAVRQEGRQGEQHGWAKEDRNMTRTGPLWARKELERDHAEHTMMENLRAAIKSYNRDPQAPIRTAADLRDLQRIEDVHRIIGPNYGSGGGNGSP
ncbi:hypothetical protein EBT31_04330 [bacterium]|nr:hypothetical protein [bacterium]